METSSLLIGVGGLFIGLVPALVIYAIQRGVNRADKEEDTWRTTKDQEVHGLREQVHKLEVAQASMITREVLDATMNRVFGEISLLRQEVVNRIISGGSQHA